MRVTWAVFLAVLPGAASAAVVTIDSVAVMQRPAVINLAVNEWGGDEINGGTFSFRLSDPRIKIVGVSFDGSIWPGGRPQLVSPASPVLGGAETVLNMGNLQPFPTVRGPLFTLRIEVGPEVPPGLYYLSANAGNFSVINRPEPVDNAVFVGGFVLVMPTDPALVPVVRPLVTVLLEYLDLLKLYLP